MTHTIESGMLSRFQCDECEEIEAWLSAEAGSTAVERVLATLLGGGLPPGWELRSAKVVDEAGTVVAGSDYHVCPACKDGR